MLAASVLFLLSGAAKAGQGKGPEKQFLKARQKQERKALKLKEHYEKQAYRSNQVPRSLRIQRKHEMQREERAMRDRQKDEREDMKDRRRLVKESLRSQR